MFATYAFSATSPCYLEMEARQCAEFTDGVELAALVEKGAAGTCTGEARSGREARWRGRKTGLSCSGAEEILAGGARRCDEEGGVVEREARWRAPSLRQHDGAWSRRAAVALR
jgi:hypothetical protein